MLQPLEMLVRDAIVESSTRQAVTIRFEGERGEVVVTTISAGVMGLLYRDLGDALRANIKRAWGSERSHVSPTPVAVEIETAPVDPVIRPFKVGGGP